MALLFTLPAANQHREAIGDTVYVECAGGPSLTDLGTARLYGQPVTGGGWRLVQEHDATGREGAPDSFLVDPGVGWHFYVTVTDLQGNESCASNAIYVPGTVTGVEPGRGDDPVLRVTRYDVHGREVRGPVASGVYFEVVRHASGLRRVRRTVVVK